MQNSNYKFLTTSPTRRSMKSTIIIQYKVRNFVNILDNCCAIITARLNDAFVASIGSECSVRDPNSRIEFTIVVNFVGLNLPT